MKVYVDELPVKVFQRVIHFDDGKLNCVELGFSEKCEPQSIELIELHDKEKDHRIAVLERALKLAVRDGYYVADSEGFYFGACNSKTSHDFYEKTNYGEDEEKCIKLHCNYFIDQAEKELKDE